MYQYCYLNKFIIFYNDVRNIISKERKKKKKNKIRNYRLAKFCGSNPTTPTLMTINLGQIQKGIKSKLNYILLTLDVNT